jgi:glycosyltransferase involved in cell wall biosynthesis
MNSIVSIVIPTYNRAFELKRALQSVLFQSYSNFEVLVVDNNSHDATDSIVDGFKDIRIKLFKVNNNGVIAISRNVGIRQSLGKYIAFLDSDDWWMPKKLEYAVRKLELGADLVYHDMLIARKNEQKFFFRRTMSRRLSGNVFENLIIHGNPIINSSVVVRKDILQQIGGLIEDVGFVTMEDYDAWLRIAQKAIKFKKISKVLGYYWLGGGNTSTPERAILSINTFEKQYINVINKIGYPWWLYYSKGRACYLLKNYSESEESLNSIVCKKVPYLVMIKIYWMKLMIKIFIMQTYLYSNE